MRRIKFTKQKVISALFVLIISLIAQYLIPNSPNNSKPSTTPTPPIYLKVIRVIDGDTIEIEGGKKVRYIGVDTPELHHPTKAVQCFAQEAYLKNKELVEGKNVRLVKDVSETDKYKRLLRYVYLQDSVATSEAMFVNQYLVENGFAYAATFPPDVKFADLFKESQRIAREKNLGLWKGCSISP